MVLSANHTPFGGTCWLNGAVINIGDEMASCGWMVDVTKIQVGKNLDFVPQKFMQIRRPWTIFIGS